jgi:hypothetical protein
MLKDLNGINPIFYLFATIAVWDGITTLFGTVLLLGAPTVGLWVGGVLASLLVGALIFMTFEIWSHSMFPGNAVLRGIIRGMWSLAVIYDIATCFYGNAKLMDVTLSNPSGIFVLFTMTVLLAFSSFMAAFLFDKHKNGGTVKEEW